MFLINFPLPPGCCTQHKPHTLTVRDSGPHNNVCVDTHKHIVDTENLYPQQKLNIQFESLNNLMWTFSKTI